MSVIWQKGESQKGGHKNTKYAKFSEKRTFFHPLIRTRTCAYQRVKNVRFSEKLAYFVFLWPPFWDSPFCHITDEKEGFHPQSQAFLQSMISILTTQCLWIFYWTGFILKDLKDHVRSSHITRNSFLKNIFVPACFLLDNT